MGLEKQCTMMTRHRQYISCEMMTWKLTDELLQYLFSEYINSAGNKSDLISKLICILCYSTDTTVHFVRVTQKLN
ncbi:hypothetical protein T11_10412 [Trichinella zimbabwensis]|uniref:Uncharacterized protein n=1 Tax=Trichinella zimbabwensis TaxID=268475 RepID=A0A0V1HKR6_9BILA|nr:hypothetical protein T11_10412 [Trichinella zimbabwensis]